MATSQSGLEAELLSTKARLAAVEAELADTKQQLAVALASSSAAAAAPPPPAAAAPAAPAGSAAPLDRPGALLVELASDLSFLSPRGKFRLSLNTGAAVLHGKSAEIAVPYRLVSRVLVLPEASGQGSLCVVTLAAPVANGKSQVGHLLLHSKPAEPKVECSLSGKPLCGQPASVVSQAFASLAAVEVGGIGSFKPFGGRAALQCYVKATEAALYLLEKELLVKEASKVHVMPYSRLRVEVLPPDSRRTFDLQLECAAADAPAGAPAKTALKLELSMLPANECDRVSELLQRKRANVNGSLDGEAASAGAVGGGAAGGGAGDDEEEEDDDDDDDEDSDFAPSEGSDVEEEYDSDGGDPVEGGDGSDEGEEEDDDEEEDENEEPAGEAEDSQAPAKRIKTEAVDA